MISGYEYLTPREERFFAEYERFIDFTTIPAKRNNISHMAFGIVEECLELMQEIDSEFPNRMEEEAGDVLWYIFGFMKLLKEPFP